MSYILDALKKAAEQREQQTPGMRRLIAPAPAREAARVGWTSAIAITLSVGAVAAIALAVVALRSGPVAMPEAVQSAPAVTRPAVVAGSASETPKPAAVIATAEAPPPAVVATVTEPPKRAAAPVEPRPAAAAPAEPPRAPTRVDASRASSAVRVDAPRAPARVEPQRPAALAAPVAPVAPSAARRRVVNPEDPEGPLLVESPVKLRLEVLVYSDVAAERMVFINGRKYKQGDTVAERARIEEIQPDSVVLSEEGRRFTLRQ